MHPKPSYPWWLWPKLLSLDAPLVAMIWFQLLARCFKIGSFGLTEITLGLFVWIIYLTDRLLDCTISFNPRSLLHQFYHDHVLRIGIFVAMILSLDIFLILQIDNSAVLKAIIPVFICLLLYFAVVHFPYFQKWRSWPRELMVGLLFVAGIWAPLSAFKTSKSGTTIDLLLITVLICLNVCGVKSWTIPGWKKLHFSTKWLGRNLTLFGIILTLIASFLYAIHQNPISLAVATSALLLSFLPQLTKRWPCEIGNLYADTVLCTPILLSIFWK